MNRIAKLALVAIAAAGIAAPALAQSYNPPLAHQSGRTAFAMVPGSVVSPAATGGGSIGYNENLRRDQW